MYCIYEGNSHISGTYLPGSRYRRYIYIDVRLSIEACKVLYSYTKLSRCNCAHAIATRDIKYLTYFTVTLSTAPAQPGPARRLGPTYLNVQLYVMWCGLLYIGHHQIHCVYALPISPPADAAHPGPVGSQFLQCAQLKYLSAFNICMWSRSDAFAPPPFPPTFVRGICMLYAVAVSAKVSWVSSWAHVSLGFLSRGTGKIDGYITTNLSRSPCHSSHNVIATYWGR